MTDQEIWIFTVEDLETGETARLSMPVDTSCGVNLGLEEAARAAAKKAEDTFGWLLAEANTETAKPGGVQ